MNHKILMICAALMLTTACAGENSPEFLSNQTQADITSTALITPKKTIESLETTPPTLTPAPVLTSTPTMMPASVEAWDQVAIQSLCLEVALNFPQFDQDSDIPVREVTAAYLEGMGIEVLPPDGSCEASLTIRMDIRSESDQYKDDQTDKKMTCYSGSSAKGTMRLSMTNRSTLEFAVNNTETPMSIFHCTTEPNPEAYFGESWVPEVTKGMLEFWGLPAAVATMKVTDSIPDGISNDAQRTALSHHREYADEDELIALLPYVMKIVEKGGSPNVNVKLGAALEILGRLEDDALPAVPFLIQGLEEELASSAPFSCPWCYSSRLESITGQEGGKDPDYWWDWWEANKPDGSD